MNFLRVSICKFQFSWWSRDHFSAPFGTYICQVPGHRLSRLAKITPSESRLSIGIYIYHWFGENCFLLAVRRILEGYPKMRKLLFWIWLRPCYKIPEFFTIAPVLTSTLTVCRRNRGDPSSLYRTYGWCPENAKNAITSRLLQKQSFWFGLEPPMRRSRSKLAYKCIPYNNRCMQNFIQIGWDLAVQGPKTCFWVKTEPGQFLAVNNWIWVLVLRSWDTEMPHHFNVTDTSTRLRIKK